MRATQMASARPVFDLHGYAKFGSDVVKGPEDRTARKNEHRPHRALRLRPPNGRDPTPLHTADRLPRRDLLGGLIHEYEAA
jgi:hypothetical protein